MMLTALCVQRPVEEEEDDPDLPSSFTRDYNFGGGPAEHAQQDGAKDGQEPPAKKSKQEACPWLAPPLHSLYHQW